MAGGDGARHGRSTGQDFGASPPFCPPPRARPCSAPGQGWRQHFSHCRRGCFLKIRGAETPPEPGLGPGADAEDTQTQGLTEVYSGRFRTGQRSPPSLHTSPKPLPCSELNDGSRARTSTSPHPPSSLRSLGMGQRGAPQRSPLPPRVLRG